MTKPVLSVRNLEVEFVTRRATLRAINGVSFDIAKGEVLGMVGESGAGKSVTGLAVIGLIEKAQRIAEIEADEVGLAILKPLRRLDVVAYLRFASVYQAFSDLDDFENAIEVLRSERAAQSNGQQALVDDEVTAPRRSKRRASAERRTSAERRRAAQPPETEQSPEQERLL